MSDKMFEATKRVASIQVSAEKTNKLLVELFDLIEDVAAYADAPKTHEMDDGEAGIVIPVDLADRASAILSDTGGSHGLERYVEFTGRR